MMKGKESVMAAAAVILSLLVFTGCPNGTTDPVAPAETCTVTYDAHGGSGGVPTDNTAYEEGASVTVHGNTGGLVLSGYTFAGWNTAADGSGSTYLEGATFTMGTEDVTLYAIWSQNVHTLSFDANGGSGEMAAQTAAEGSTVSLPDSGFTLSGYAFTGWNTAADGSGTTYLEGATFTMETDDVTLYATWSQNVHTLSFDSNGGNGTMTDRTVAEGATVTLPAGDFIRDGYTFAGWARTAGGSVEYADEASLAMGTSDVTLYAVWTINTYTITYNLDGGTNSGSNPASYTVESAAITLADPTGTGYTFDGWYSDEALTTEVTGTAITAGSTGNKAFYAKWTAVEYSITYILDGGTNNGSNPANYTVESNAITLADPTGTGYTFGGWYSDEALTTQVTGTAITAGSTGNKAFYAKWTAVEYSITYHLDGGTNSGSNPANYTIESAAVTLADPTRTGYTFGGWFSDSALTTQVPGTAIAAGSTGNKAFYAKWTPQGTVTTELKEGVQIAITGTGSGDSGLTAGVGDTLTIGVNGSDIYASYQWYRDGNELSGENNQTLELTLNTPGNATYTVVVTDGDGNGFSESVIVRVTN